MQFKKGPYFADEGDFSAAGAANINYVNQLERPMVERERRQRRLGPGLRRRVAARRRRLSARRRSRSNHNDGPWVRPDDYQKVNGVLRFSRGDNRNGFSLTGMGYWADWDSTDQVPERAIASGLIPRFGLLDPSDGGKANRQSLAAEFQRSDGPSSLRATGFVLRNSLNLFSNFTYFLDDPENGDQFEQAERRVAAGGRVTYRRLGHFFDRHTESAVGVQVRRDWLDPVGLYRTAARAAALDDARRRGRPDAWRPSTRRPRSSGRARSARRSGCAPTGTSSRVDLRQSAQLRRRLRRPGQSRSSAPSSGPWSGTELYANAGTGFHSNDARGAAITRRSGHRRAGRSRDAAGARERRGGRPAHGPRSADFSRRWRCGTWASTRSCCSSAMPGRPKPGRPSRRVGVEWTNYARAHAVADARRRSRVLRARASPTTIRPGTAFPGALDRVISAGVTVEPQRPLFGSLRVRHFGPRPLIEDASVTSKSTTIWNGEVGYRLSRRARLVLEAFNLFDAEVSDIDYFYASRLPGEPEAIEDIHLHPAPPFTVRAGVQFSF